MTTKISNGPKRWSQTRKTSVDEIKTVSIPKTVFLSEDRSKQTIAEKDASFFQEQGSPIPVELQRISMMEN